MSALKQLLSCDAFNSKNGLRSPFLPSPRVAQETIHKQAVLCHRVLRRVQDVVQQSVVVDRETWEAILAFLLAINDALLAPPAIKGERERVFYVL